ncbi:YitT family protein [Paenactinomyces guangxiensis]|uniref:YitT family protein n=1 Tax=Paenactinomyces guangxiensis TaxID=1490290 RepID=A0A7W1WMW1_9BACL|nr:YitT family protein [Paenactinomyces guangxiensis]MBA4492819.1 YitT family protein [Paenactinomyces guangxiensis]MBH8590332.1 YitT family protein [Paenactinomyces guangxiensis]
MKISLHRIIAYILGLIILSFGISLVIRANIGTGAWDALNVGLSQKVGLTVGSWVIIVGFILIAVNAFLLKERPDFPAMITILLIGFLIDGWLFLLQWETNQWVWQFLLFSLGTLVIAVGLAVYFQAQFAMTSVDKLMYAISKRTGFSLRVSKTIGEVLALILAWLLEGPIGIGTILITFLIGPLLQFFLPKIEPFFQKK